MHIESKRPAAFINCLLFLSLFLLFAVLFVSLVVKYPHTIEGKIVLVASSRPFEMLAPQAGKLMLLKCEGDTIEEASDVAYVFKSTNYFAVSRMYECIKSGDLDRIYSCLADTSVTNHVGDLSSACNDLSLSLYEWLNYETINQLKSKTDIMRLKDSISRSQLDVESQILCYESLIEQQLNLMCQEDSLLFLNGSVSKIQLDQSVRNSLQQKQKVQSINSALLTLKQDILENAMELNNFVEVVRLKKNMLYQGVLSKVSNLQSAIETWRAQSVIVSPLCGHFELFPDVSDGQTVVSGLQIIRIVPFDDGVLKGEMLFDSKESGVLKGNEKVKITMDSYSPNQYGYLMGEVTGYSSSVYSDPGTASSLRMANVSIDMKNQPFWWTELNYVHDMAGKSEIIVEDRSLLEQMFNFILINMN